MARAARVAELELLVDRDLVAAPGDRARRRRAPSRPRRRPRPSRGLREDRVGDPRPRLERPRVELAVGEAGAGEAAPRGRSRGTCRCRRSGRRCRGELRVPVQCGCFPSRSSTPRPQSFGSKRPMSGRTPGEAGELHGRHLGEGLRRDERRRDWSSRANATRSSSVPWIPAAGDPRSSALIPSGSITAARR